MRLECELRNLPRFRIMDYLVSAGGIIIGNHAVAGDRWAAYIEGMESAQVGSIKIPRDRLVIEGDRSAVERVGNFMRKKTMRGGG